MRHYEEMRDALRNDPQALIFLDAAQVAKQAFGLAMLAVRPPVPAKTSAPRTVPSKWLGETHRDRLQSFIERSRPEDEDGERWISVSHAPPLAPMRTISVACSSS